MIWEKVGVTISETDNNDMNEAKLTGSQGYEPVFFIICGPLHYYALL